jgi:hypothetical protein
VQRGERPKLVPGHCQDLGSPGLPGAFHLFVAPFLLCGGPCPHLLTGLRGPVLLYGVYSLEPPLVPGPQNGEQSYRAAESSCLSNGGGVCGEKWSPLGKTHPTPPKTIRITHRAWLLETKGPRHSPHWTQVPEFSARLWVTSVPSSECS